MKIFRLSIYSTIVFLFSVATIQAQELTISEITSTPTSCGGGSDGSITVTISGGVAPYTYLLAIGATPMELGGPTTSQTFTFSGHSKSSYVVLVSDADTVTALSGASIGGPDPISIFSYMTTNISCNGESDGIIEVVAQGESGNYDYRLVGPVVDDNEFGIFNDLPAGDYTVTVQDQNNCPSTDVTPILTIINPDPLSVSVDDVGSVNCFGESTGLISITPLGGTPSFTYEWRGPDGFEASSQDISNIKAGDYSLTLTDVNGCSREFDDLVNIPQNSAITATFSISHDSCYRDSNGAINTSVSGGIPDYEYEWTGPGGFSSTAKDISGLIQGDYQLTVTDDLGCEQEMEVQTVNEPAPLAATSTHVDIKCFGDGDGSIDLTVTGGTTPYAISWTGPGGYTANTEDISGLEAGDYSVTIIDEHLCNLERINIVTIAEPDPILVDTSKTDITCNGFNDGTIDITVTGGTLPYVFDWTGPSGFSSDAEDLSGLAAGSYNLTIKDANDCELIINNLATITEPDAIVATYVSHQDVLCYGDSTGSIQIDVAGGRPPLDFDWTNSSGATISNDEDPTGLPEGIYSLTISDLSGCSATYPDFRSVSESPLINSTLTPTHITCNGDGDGIITIDSEGGNGSHRYSMVGEAGPFQSGTTFTSLDPGLYTVWTRDENLCVVMDTITLFEPELIEVQAETIISENLCYGDSSAQVSIDAVSGGVPPYTYSINGGIDFYGSKLFSNLPAGNYQSVVKDINECLGSGIPFIIGQPEQLAVDSISILHVTSCFDANEGRIQLAGTGGTGIIRYTLNGTQQNTTGDFPNLPAGTYQVSMLDENDCSWDSTVTVLAPSELLITNVTINNVTACSGDSTGSVSLSGSGGTVPYRYSIDGGPLTGINSFINLPSGSYTLRLTDGGDCFKDTVISIGEPAPIVILSEEITPISCAGDNNGTIRVSASGGTGSLEFTLNPGAITHGIGEFKDLTPGTYTVSVTDSPGCGPAISSPLTISEPPVLVLDSIIDQNISCFNAADGYIEVFASGGVPPYVYSVDNQSSWSPDSLISGLTPASYEVYVRDSNQCLADGGSIELEGPPEITLAIVPTHITICAGDTTGEIVVSASGGIGILEYSLDGLNFGSDTAFNNLTAGTYPITVRDETACIVTQPTEITEPAAIMADISKTDALDGGLGSITISNTTGGTPPYLYTIEGPSGTFTSDTVYPDLVTAIYHVIITDVKGCTYEQMVNIYDILPIEMVLSIQHVSCFGEEDAFIEFFPQDAEGAVEYSIDSGMNFVPTARFENLPGNITYNLIARDEAGKEFSGIVFITEPPEIIVTGSTTPSICNAFDESGAIGITASGGTGSFSFLWSDGSTVEDRPNIVGGFHTLMTSDSSGCSRIDTFEVNSLIIVDADAGEDRTICYGDSIQLSGLGGHVPAWDPSPFLTDTAVADPISLAITESTDFVLTIREVSSPYGCYNVDTVHISLYPATGLELTKDTLIGLGSTLQLEVTGGPFSAYRWEPGTGLDNSFIADPIATVFDPIVYYVFATNTYGCEEVDSIFIDVDEGLVVYNVFSPNGDGINDYFEIENSEQYPDMQVEIYSRWGDLLYSASGYDSGSRWDGTARGKNAPVGTYYYVIIPYSGADPITGNVTIIR